MALDELFESYQDFLEFQHLYIAAISEIETKLSILNDEFKIHHSRNPIHHIESRIKANESIVAKLRKKGFEITPESARQNINDIAGIRVVCNYIDDVYRVAEMLLRQSDIVLVKKQDYIKEPNYNGYRSLHLDVKVPIFLSDQTLEVIAEIQIRTIAMDFWASLEHDLHYKGEKEIPDSICVEMLRSADEIAEIDRRMQETFLQIQELD